MNQSVSQLIQRLLGSMLLLLLLLVSQPGFSLTTDKLEPLLKKSTWSQLEQVVISLTNEGSDASQTVLEHWLNGRLFVVKKQKQLVYAEKTPEKKYRIYDLLSSDELGTVKKRALKKVRINNQLRSVLKTALASWDLKSKNPDTRKKAIYASLKTLDNKTLNAFHVMRANEKNKKVLSALDVALSLHTFQTAKGAAQLEAIHVLTDFNHPYVRSELAASLADTSSTELAQSIRVALAEIDQRQQYYGMAESVFFGLSLGSVLLLSAIGLAITFGVMGVINMAHGEMMMLGAYTTFVIQSVFPNLIDQSLFIAIPMAFLVAGAAGVLIERLVIRHLYGRPLETLLATFGISLILQQAVRTIFSPLNQEVATPSWMSGSWIINEALSLTWNRLYIVGFSLLIFFALLFVMRYTRFGLNIRAVTQNRAMASSMGIPTGKMDALTFGLGSGIAGVAGVALSQLTNVGPNLGQNYIIDSFMVVVFGGVGSLWGTLVAAMGLGVVNKFLEPWAGAVVAKILVLVFIILFIQKRPRGLFALKGRAVEG
ncbi:urea ABC transporter permease subunit UrtB [uncultured Endozoicomonas sp.]|uniref:urea ABC transporter permease subunit UrtB n=1 Tax=uncultured Endozoicomonas sp. TaxID=432652 RepID=UPI00263299FF|nr:urea ABC transporter permease subunit UrtB [uncultured Endozoicomonas sp.]